MVRASRKALTLAVVLGLSVAAVRAQPPATDKVAATVNGEKIMESEVRAILDIRTPSPITLTAADKKKMLDDVINMLVDDALMRQFLKKSATPATPQEIQKEFTELEEDLKKKGTSLKEYLTSSKQTEDQIKTD